MGDADGTGEDSLTPSEGVPTSDYGEAGVGPGAQIGPYKLIRILGEGGFGIVYLAEQLHPIRRGVALKVIKPGMDTRQVIARFEAERQALALLDHPNIAHVFDAGTTPGGHPYFAMEYITGIPITEYCDQYKLGTRTRLELFISLCQGIQYAHQKGIIHRDIKPSNVLVTLQNGKPFLKIIDFGVAKALNQHLTQKTLFTDKGEFIGTPEYMSPEQAGTTDLDIDTRADIYSLGVLLYELLTGSTPFDGKELRSKGYAEIQRILCEQEPAKPSTRLTTLGEKLEDIAKCRGSAPDQLRKTIRGDLDWIVMKTLEKDRTRRYSTADGLAMDIERHLAYEPIVAGRPGPLYRFQKLMRRHKGIFSAAAVVAAVLVLGALVSIWQAVRATRARQQAEAKELARRQLAYASDISLAQQALSMNDLARARQLLDDHRPHPGEVDLRGWEWRYLWQECRSDSLGELCRYPNSVYSVAYSPDGKMLAVTGLLREFVDIWDTSSRQRITNLQSEEAQLVAFSPRGDLLVTDAGNQVRVWRTGTWSRVSELSLAGHAIALKFSPDGGRLAGASERDEVILWETDRWTVVGRIRGAKLRRGHNDSLDFSPDGEAVVLACGDRHLRAFDLASGNAIVDIPQACPEPSIAVAWSPTGSVIASGCAYNGGPIRLWDVVAGTCVGEMNGHTGYTYQLVFSKDGKRLYSAAGDHTIRIWHVEQQRCLTTLRGSTHEVYGIAISPDGTTLASACKDGGVTLWNAEPKPEVRLPRIAVSGFPTFSPDSRFLAVPHKAGAISLFNLATLREDERIPALDSSGVSAIHYSPTGTWVTIGTWGGRIGVWSCNERRMLRELPGHKNSVFGLYIRSDDMRLFSIDIEGKAIVWDTLSWRPLRSFVVPDVGVGDVSSDFRLGAVKSGGDLRWFDETGTHLETTPGHRWPINRVTFSDDDSRVATVAADGTVALWDPSSFKRIIMFRGHMQGAYGVTFSPDGRRLATGGATGRDAVKVWDLSMASSNQPPRELITLPGKGSVFRWVLFSPDGQWLTAICETEGTVDLWHVPSWVEIEAEQKKQSEHSP